MKQWNHPYVEELKFQDTSFILSLLDEPSGPELPGITVTPIPTVKPSAPSGQKDLGTCSNPYWAGNGLSQEEASANNPFWAGSWGK